MTEQLAEARLRRELHLVPVAGTPMTRILGEWTAGDNQDIHVAMVWQRGWMDGDNSEVITVFTGGWPVLTFTREDWERPEEERWQTFGRYLDQADGQSESDLRVAAAVMWTATGTWSYDDYETWIGSAAAEAGAWFITAEGRQHTIEHARLMELGARLAGWKMPDGVEENHEE